MNKSETIAKLAKALVGFQAEVATIGTDKKNPFFKNEYATLGQLIEDTKKLREKYGLAVSQIPIGEGGLVTMVLHESGEYLSATSEIRLESEKGNSLAQSAGKLITYQRRYAYAAILGLVSDKDADGNMKEPVPPPPPEMILSNLKNGIYRKLRYGTKAQKIKIAEMLSSPLFSHDMDKFIGEVNLCYNDLISEEELLEKVIVQIELINQELTAREAKNKK